MSSLGNVNHEDLPELVRVFHLQRNGLGTRRNENENRNTSTISSGSSCWYKTTKGDCHGNVTGKDHKHGFDYKAATKLLREKPGQVQYVIYDGWTNTNRCQHEHDGSSSSVFGSNKSSVEHSGGGNVFNSKCNFLHTPLGWACVETTQEEDAMEFLRTVRDIDPTLFLVQDRHGALPIEGDCILNASMPMLRFLLEIYLDYDFFCPNGPKVTEDNFNPLTCLCGSCWWEDLQQAHREITSGDRIVKGRSVLEDNLGIDDNFWARIILLAKAFYHKTIDDVHESNSSAGLNYPPQLLRISNEYGDRTIRFRLLHACAGIDWFPPNLLRLLVTAFPDTLLDRDEDGNLPIHVAASGVFDSYKIDATWEGDLQANSGYQRTTIDIFLEANPNLARVPNEEGKLPLELALECEYEPINDSTSPDDAIYSRPTTRPWVDGGIQSLLQAFPAAAGIRSLANRKLPLEIAIENHREWEDGIRDLLEAYPAATRSCNPFTGKFPLELAIEKEIHFDEGVYGLLEASPAMVTDESGCMRLSRTGSEASPKNTDSADSTTTTLPLFAQSAAEGCSVSVIYKLLRTWPQSCRISPRCGTKPKSEQLGARTTRRTATTVFCDVPSGKRQKTSPHDRTTDTRDGFQTNDIEHD